MKLYIYGKVYFYYKLSCFTEIFKKKKKKKKKNRLDYAADQNKFRHFFLEISRFFRNWLTRKNNEVMTLVFFNDSLATQNIDQGFVASSKSMAPPVISTPEIF